MDVDIKKLAANVTYEVSKVDKLHKMVAEDEISDELLHDFVEGETQTFELLDIVWQEIEERKIYITGIKEHLKGATDRKRRFENGMEKLRTVMAFVMKRSNQTKIVRPLYTISITDTPEKIVIKDEAAIPSRFFKVPEPQLDKEAVLVALLNGESIPGVELSDKGFGIAIRNK